jgi:hypothetical protein
MSEPIRIVVDDVCVACSNYTKNRVYYAAITFLSPSRFYHFGTCVQTGETFETVPLQKMFLLTVASVQLERTQKVQNFLLRRRNNSGPRVDPWGTPEDVVVSSHPKPYEVIVKVIVNSDEFVFGL